MPRQAPSLPFANNTSANNLLASSTSPTSQYHTLPAEAAVGVEHPLVAATIAFLPGHLVKGMTNSNSQYVSCLLAGVG
jgi:hypothetical protein